jgi:hypothetical protein
MMGSRKSPAFSTCLANATFLEVVLLVRQEHCPHVILPAEKLLLVLHDPST